jgi:hypothetical protein
MSQLNKTTLQTNINSQLADNTSRNISAADVRDNLINITDSLLFNSGSQSIDGSLTVTSFTGSLLGTATTASYVENAQTASYVENAQTASYVENAQTASYVENAQTNAISASYAPDTTFPFTGSAIITGSLTVIGSFNQASASLATGLFAHAQGFAVMPQHQETIHTQKDLKQHHHNTIHMQKVVVH